MIRLENVERDKHKFLHVPSLLVVYLVCKHISGKAKLLLIPIFVMT